MGLDISNSRHTVGFGSRALLNSTPSKSTTSGLDFNSCRRSDGFGNREHVSVTRRWPLLGLADATYDLRDHISLRPDSVSRFVKMTSCAATTMAASGLSLKRSAAEQASAAPQASFAGLRRGTKVDSLAVSRASSFASRTAIAKSAAKVTCDAANTPLIISASTATLLALGRFVFLPFQRSMVSRQGLPEQNGVTHYEAGDSRAQEVVSMLKTNDPAGFTLVDVLAWGALGHAVGFFILATATNGYNGF